MLTSIKGAPADYGVESGKLKPFEKLLQNLEGKLLEGKIFRVCSHVYIIVYIYDIVDVHYLHPAVLYRCIYVHVCTAASCVCVLLSLQNCVTQIFDTREVEVTQNTTLAEEFSINIRMFFHNIDRKIGNTREACYIHVFMLYSSVCHNVLEVPLYIRVHDCSIYYCAGDATEMGQRQQVMALCAVMVLQFQIYNQADPKLTKLVWDLHRKVHVLV